MEHKQITHFLYTPFTGLGLYNGHRGSRWLRNRIKIFKQFVVPSLLAQSSQEFKLWVSWRYEDKGDAQVLELERYLREKFGSERVIFTFNGVCFWDDKYSDEEAHTRLVDAVHGSLQTLINAVGECDSVLMTIQPSDDCYFKDSVKEIQQSFREDAGLQALGYRKGYVTDYTTLKIAEWNPKTIPPFFTIKFPRAIFIDPLKHIKFTGPYKSHEYIANNLVWGETDKRGFLVGTHGENISTVFNHPFRGADVNNGVLQEFGLSDVAPLKIKTSLRKILMRKLPAGWQRKLRYWLGERFYAKFYKFIRN